MLPGPCQHYTKLKRLARDEYSSLLGPFISNNNTAPAAKVMKHFTVVIYECVNIKVQFVPGKLLLPSIMFPSKARAYPSETPSKDLQSLN